MANGGNAIDGAAVVQFVLSVVQPQSMGIGGGCLVLYYDAATEKMYALDGREEAPAAFSGRQFCKNNDCMLNPKCDCSNGTVEISDRQTGGHSNGVPGAVYATARLLQDFGTISLAQALQPAIEIARNGFPMYSGLYNSIVSHADRLVDFPASVKLFLKPGTLTPIVEIG